MSIKTLFRRYLLSWAGAILFHLIVLIIAILFFNFCPELKTPPGERVALGGIALEDGNRQDTGGRENGSKKQSSPNSEQSSLTDILKGEFSEINPAVKLPDIIGLPAASGNNVNTVEGALFGNLGSGIQRGGGGKLQKDGKNVNLFGTNGKGSAFVFVFDRSNSMSEMNERPLRTAKAELRRAIDQLEPLHRFNVIFYNEQPQTWRVNRGMVFASDDNKESVKKFISGITASGGTRHYDPLLQAIKMRADVIFFLTDGEEADALTNGQLADLEKRNGGLTQINVIQFGLGERRESAFLRRIAAANRGEYVYINLYELQ